MKIQVICEDCGKIVELKPETRGNSCYSFGKLKNVNFSCETDIESSVTSEIEEIKEFDNTSEIELESTLNNIRFTCNNCGAYIELTNLDD